MATTVNADLGLTLYSDDENLPTVVDLFAHTNGQLTITLRTRDRSATFTAFLSRDQALWLASALVEATSEVPNAER